MTDTGRIILKGNASLCLYLLQLVQRFKAAISNRLVGEWPEAEASLELWRVWWQKHEMDAMRNHQRLTVMLSGAI